MFNKKVLIRPIVTEKATKLPSHKVLVLISSDATKHDVEAYIETQYGRKVENVAILRNPAKFRVVGKGNTIVKRVVQKKALITLKKGEKPIDFIKMEK